MKQKLLAVFLPNRSIDRKMALFLVACWAGIGLLVWVMSPFATLPRPGEVWQGLSEVWWDHGMGPELFTTMKLIFHALFFTVVLSLLLSYATVIAAMRPLVEAVSKLRFLGLTGLVVPFTLMSGGGYPLKVALLTFGMTVFFVTAMAQVVVEIPRQRYDHMRVLGAGELRILWEVVILGTLDKALDCMRQNLAMGWMMITMVEGISRTEGGVGARLLELNRLFYLDKVFAVLFIILIVGLILDYAAGVLSRILCPHAHLRRMH